jgi:hypothetical protein
VSATPQKPVPTKVLALQVAAQFHGKSGPVKTSADVLLAKRWLKNVNVKLSLQLQAQKLHPPQPHHHNVSTKPDALELSVNNGTTLVMLATLVLASKTV